MATAPAIAASAPTNSTTTIRWLWATARSAPRSGACRTPTAASWWRRRCDGRLRYPPDAVPGRLDAGGAVNCGMEALMPPHMPPLPPRDGRRPTAADRFLATHYTNKGPYFVGRAECAELQAKCRMAERYVFDEEGAAA